MSLTISKAILSGRGRTVCRCDGGFSWIIATFYNWRLPEKVKKITSRGMMYRGGINILMKKRKNVSSYNDK